MPTHAGKSVLRRRCLRAIAYAHVGKTNTHSCCEKDMQNRFYEWQMVLAPPTRGKLIAARHVFSAARIPPTTHALSANTCLRDSSAHAMKSPATIACTHGQNLQCRHITHNTIRLPTRALVKQHSRRPLRGLSPIAYARVKAMFSVFAWHYPAFHEMNDTFLRASCNRFATNFVKRAYGLR